MSSYSRDVEIVNVLAAIPLNIGTRRTFGPEFFMGEGWYTMNFRVNLALVVGTGTGPVSEGELRIIKNITVRTDKGELICSLPGRALYRRAANIVGSPPRKDAILAASGTYSVDIPLHLADPRMMKPEDTILNTARYLSVVVEVTLGTVADLLSVPGTATVTATIDCDILQTSGPLPEEAWPEAHTHLITMSPIDASTTTSVNIDKAADLFIKRLMCHASAGGTAGEVFSGANADDVQATESVEDNFGFIVKTRSHAMIQNQNKNSYGLENVPTGITTFDFVEDGSIYSAIASGNRSKLVYTFTNVAGVAAGDIVTVMVDGFRDLR